MKDATATMGSVLKEAPGARDAVHVGPNTSAVRAEVMTTIAEWFESLTPIERKVLNLILRHRDPVFFAGHETYHPGMIVLLAKETIYQALSERIQYRERLGYHKTHDSVLVSMLKKLEKVKVQLPTA